MEESLLPQFPPFGAGRCHWSDWAVLGARGGSEPLPPLGTSRGDSSGHGEGGPGGMGDGLCPFWGVPCPFLFLGVPLGVPSQLWGGSL